VNLHDAVANRDLEGVRQAIAAGAVLDETREGATAIERAAQTRQYDAVKLLLQAGANPTLGLRGALGAAYQRQDQTMVELLLTHVDPAASPHPLEGALGWNAEAALALLARGVPFFPQLAPLAAEARGAPEARATLLDRAVAATVDAQPMLTALVATQHVERRWVDALLAKGASLTPAAHPSPLHVAALTPTQQPIELLLELGASVDTPLAVDWVRKEKTWAKGLTVREAFVDFVRADLRGRDDDRFTRARAGFLKKVAKALGVEVGGKSGEVLKTGRKSAPASKDPTKVKVAKGWRRFHHANGQFWEVRALPRDLQTRWGTLGGLSRTSTRHLDSSAQVELELRKSCDEKLKAGFAEVGVTPPPERDEAQEAKLEAAPDEWPAYERYSAWLRERAHPLGELISAQRRGDGAAVLKKHAAMLLGPLVRFPKKGKPGAQGSTAEWRFGFVKHLELRWPMTPERGALTAEQDLEALFALPTARLLESLKVGPLPGRGASMSGQPVLDVLVTTKAASRLKALFLVERGQWDWRDTRTGDFGKVHSHFPRLESLTLSGGTIQLGKRTSLPALRELSLQTGALSRATLAEVTSLDAPKLERLSIWFGRAQYGANTKLADLATILDGSRFPKLKHLGLMNCEWIGEAVRALPSSKLLPRLSSLDLSMGCLNDADVAAMQAQRSAFAHLARLNLEDNGLTKKAVTKGLASEVHLGKQDPKRAERYASVGE